MIRVAYVVGAGRSGSTVLGIALGQLPGAFFAGELDAWLQRGGEPNSERPEVHAFWSCVRENVKPPVDGRDDRYHRLLEHPAGLGRRITMPPKKRRELEMRYRAVNRALYRAIADAAHTGTIIDSSHYPLRLNELLALDGVEMRAIHLIRDPRSVVASMVGGLQRRQTAAGAVLYNWTVAVLSAFVLRKLPPGRSKRVRYEDFVANPVATLRDLAEWLELDASEFDHRNMRPGPLFQGNRMRTQDVVAVDAPGPAPPTPRGHLVETLLLPLRWLYGYR